MARETAECVVFLQQMEKQDSGFSERSPDEMQ
jgi:hypothetical protein